jgi:hypothetical protein
MPLALSYPGVYIEEVESGVRPITGVATSITAFVGRTLRGPVDVPVTISGYGEFERVFGGLWADSPLGYAVRDFFLNGGGQAIVVRLFNVSDEAEAAAAAVAKAAQDSVDGGETDPVKVAAAARAAVTGASGSDSHQAGDAVATAAETAAVPGASPADVAGAADDAQANAVSGAAPGFARIDVNGLTLEAASPGAWGNSLRARIDDDVAPGTTGLFNLSVYDGETGTVELYRNVSVDPAHARRIDKVLEKSALVRVRGALPGSAPTAHADPAPGQKLWDDNAPPTNSETDTAFIATNGDPADEAHFTGPGLEGAKRGLYALDKADLFNLLCLPPHVQGGTIENSLVDAALTYCERRRAMLIIDPPADWASVADALAGVETDVGRAHPNGALFFPRAIESDPLREGRQEAFAPCGAVAGLFARTDAERGVWKAPAGLAASLANVAALQVPLTDMENGQLNMRGINCLRSMPPAGRVVWGARTREGDDRFASQWKYVPVRRTALFIEESLYRGTQWVVFEPNDEPLWANIRLNVGSFMQRLFRQGAFQGTSARDAYFVKCDGETTTQADIDLGIVNILVGFAPLKPAEFVVIRLQQIAGNIPT